MWKSIINDKHVHEFLFKYAAIILAFGVSSVIGGVNALAPLDDKIYERYYQAKAEVELRNDRLSVANKPGTLMPESAEKYNEKELFLKARANLTSAEHSKDLILTLVDMNQAIFVLCRNLFFLMFVLAAGHWFMYKSSEQEKQAEG